MLGLKGWTLTWVPCHGGQEAILPLEQVLVEGNPSNPPLLWVFGGNSLSGVGCGGFKSCRSHLGLLRLSSYSLTVSLFVLAAVLL